MYADPLRKHDCAPVTDGAAAIVLAADDRAREVAERPAWITGLSTYVDPISMGTRDLTRSPSTGQRRRATSDLDGVEVAELHAPFSHQELILRTELGLADDVAINPSGGPLAGQPDVHRRPDPLRRGRQEGLVRRRRQGARPRDERTGAAAEPRVRDGRQGK